MDAARPGPSRHISPPRQRKMTKMNKPLDVTEKEVIINLYKKLTRTTVRKLDVIKEVAATLGIICVFYEAVACILSKCVL